MEERKIAAGAQDDVRGHRYEAGQWSDETLKQAITQVQDALRALQQLDTSGGDDAAGLRA
jgi:hypothetical protein